MIRIGLAFTFETTESLEYAVILGPHQSYDVNVNVTAFMYHAGLITQLWTAALMRNSY